MTQKRLENKVAVITGASRGIGEAIARKFAAEGAHVVLVSRKQDGLDAVAEAIRGAGGEATPIACHIGKMSDIDVLFTRVEKEFGRVDVLVNNAATNVYFGPMIEAPEDAYDKTFDVNVKGNFFMAQRAAKSMVTQNAGSIVNIASVTGITPPPFQGIYAMTKAALIMMTKALAGELAATGVRCNAICPGLVETKFAKVLIETPEIYNEFMRHTPMKRHAQPEEIAGAALFLASDDASYTTGAILTCDGGYTI